MLPLRFIAVCPAGHVEDFPWDAWAHSEAKQGLSREGGCGKGSLYFYATKRGGLSGLIVSCGGCGRKRSLMGSTNPQGLKGLQCRGNRPWLGKDAAEICNAPPGRGGVRQMLALQRGASNLYFPEVASSILIPPYSSKIRQLISDRQIIEALESGLENGRIPTSAFRAVAKLHRVDARQLEEAYYARGGNSTDAGSSDETAFRHHEYFALLQERRERDDALSCRPRELSRYAAIVRNFFENVTLVEKLTETRALTSFSRIRPGASGGHNLSLAPVSWLPAFRVTGEGVFLTLNAERLRVFERAEGSRLAPLLERARAYNRSPLPVSSRLVLVHTLAHLLIKRLSFEAGYGASSIRERVYSSVEPSSQPMAGILLYTAAGDADGTLGGLVGLGAPGMLERAVAGALEDARWCASDPICAESKGQGPDSLNLAACHACALLPETSCEFQNRLLDRAAVTRYFEGGATRW